MNEASSPVESCPQCGARHPGDADTASAASTCPQCGSAYSSAEPASATETGNGTEGDGAQMEQPVPSPVGSRGPWLVVGLALVLLMGGAGWMYRNRNNSGDPAVRSAANTESLAKRPKSLTDLRVHAISLEETNGSKLLYAVGTLQNDSEYQRFGVKIVLDLLDRDGRKLTTATDYVAIVEPHGTWRFRALVVDPKATAARVAHVSEE